VCLTEYKANHPAIIKVFEMVVFDLVTLPNVLTSILNLAQPTKSCLKRSWMVAFYVLASWTVRLLRKN
jgi:hypothetical protein